MADTRQATSPTQRPGKHERAKLPPPQVRLYYVENLGTERSRYRKSETKYMSQGTQNKSSNSFTHGANMPKIAQITMCGLRLADSSARMTGSQREQNSDQAAGACSPEPTGERGKKEREEKEETK